MPGSSRSSWTTWTTTAERQGDGARRSGTRSPVTGPTARRYGTVSSTSWLSSHHPEFVGLRVLRSLPSALPTRHRHHFDHHHYHYDVGFNADIWREWHSHSQSSHFRIAIPISIPVPNATRSYSINPFPSNFGTKFPFPPTGHTPLYLADDCCLVSDSTRRSLWSADVPTCVLPRTLRSYSDRTFAAAGPRLWNSLPVQLSNPDITYGH